MKRIFLHSFVFLTFLLLLVLSCSKPTEFTEYTNPYDEQSDAFIPHPDLVTLEVDSIRAFEAWSGGEFTNDYGSPITAKGVCWSAEENPTIDGSCTNDGTGTSSFTSIMSNLNPETQYYVRAYVINSEGTAYGNERYFFTEAEVVLPTVNTTAITSVTKNSAQSGGNVTDDGGASITARGVCWSTTQNPTNSDDCSYDGVGLGSFNSNLPNLSPVTQYYVRAYATNTEGTAYGNQNKFTTLESSFFIHSNGVTIMCPDTSPGDIGIVNGSEYESVDKELLIHRRDEGADLSKVCTSHVTDMSELFRLRDFNQPIGNWDVSNVTDMSFMFASTSSFNQPIENWDVSNVTDMSGMFEGNTDEREDGGGDITFIYTKNPFNQPIGDWNVSSVTNMRRMFNVSQFNQSIENWDLRNVTNTSNMFSRSEFNQPIGNWDMSNVTNMFGMFLESSFNQPIGDWNVSNVTDMTSMFNRAETFNQVIGDWDVSRVTTMNRMFLGSTFNQPIGNWNVSNVLNMFAMFFNSEFNQPINRWCVSLITSEPGSFSTNSPLTDENKPIWGTCPD